MRRDVPKEVLLLISIAVANLPKRSDGKFIWN